MAIDRHLIESIDDVSSSISSLNGYMYQISESLKKIANALDHTTGAGEDEKNDK